MSRNCAKIEPRPNSRFSSCPDARWFLLSCEECGNFTIQFGRMMALVGIQGKVRFLTAFASVALTLCFDTYRAKCWFLQYKVLGTHTLESLLCRRKHAPATGDRSRVVAERDRLRDFNLVTDVRLELEEPALEARAVVGGEGHSAARARLDLVVNGESSTADGRDTRVDAVADERSVADPVPSPRQLDVPHGSGAPALSENRTRSTRVEDLVPSRGREAPGR
eukprot:scaffold95822_cov77-Phaeocystis_antarctica.AAC.1